jgi:hypothetical protein
MIVAELPATEGQPLIILAEKAVVAMARDSIKRVVVRSDYWFIETVNNFDEVNGYYIVDAIKKGD